MNNIWIYICMALSYGVICGGVYTWLNSRRKGSWRIMARSTAYFTAIGAVLTWLFYIVFK